MGEMKFPDTKIGELATGVRNWPPQGSQPGEVKVPEPPPPQAPPPVPPVAPRIPLPPPIRPSVIAPWVRKR